MGPSVKLDSFDFLNASCEQFIVGFDGKRVRHQGKVDVEIVLSGQPAKVRAIRFNKVLPGVDVIFGMDVLRRHRIQFDGRRFSIAASAEPAAHHVKGHGFEAVFDGDHWTAKLEWSADPKMKKRVASYRISEHPCRPIYGRDERRINIRVHNIHASMSTCRKSFKKESSAGSREGGLALWEGRDAMSVDDGSGWIPLMVVEQVTKGKTRLIFDYREVNEFVFSGRQMRRTAH